VLLPLVLKRDLPLWMPVMAVAIAVVLAGGVIFAITTGHWPFKG
jgi:Na+-transporting NADH:ubiquinone oxidoreductase subunit NqrB